jgi:hypothetical protein
MSLSTCPAATFANTRKPREKERKPTEIISSSMEGTKSEKVTTSIANWFCTDIETNPERSPSAILSIKTDSKMVERMSTICVAVTQDNENARAKLK